MKTKKTLGQIAGSASDILMRVVAGIRSHATEELIACGYSRGKIDDMLCRGGGGAASPIDLSAPKAGKTERAAFSAFHALLHLRDYELARATGQWDLAALCLLNAERTMPSKNVGALEKRIGTQMTKLSGLQREIGVLNLALDICRSDFPDTPPHSVKAVMQSLPTSVFENTSSGSFYAMIKRHGGIGAVWKRSKGMPLE